MRTVKASAPGKAVLCGEYAVLAGAPAIVTALNRRATVVVSEVDGEFHSVCAPGFSDRRWTFSSAEDGSIIWREPAGAQLFGLLSAVWRTLRPVSGSGLSITIDSRQLYDAESAVKIGLGSSASVATSLVCALVHWSECDGDPYLIAHNAHRNFQGGSGSGVDVAASYHGDAVVFTRGAMPVRASWPAGLYYRFFWSGVPADTAARLENLDANAATEEVSTSAQMLAAHAGQAANAWIAGNAAGALNSIAEFSSSLMEFADELNLDVFGAGHQGMVELASQCGIVYKPCGAGGGDIGVALSSDDQALATFCTKAADKGFQSLDVVVDNAGVITDIKT